MASNTTTPAAGPRTKPPTSQLTNPACGSGNTATHPRNAWNRKSKRIWNWTSKIYLPIKEALHHRDTESQRKQEQENFLDLPSLWLCSEGSGLQPRFNPRAGIKKIAQGIPNKIKREHCQHHRDGWKDYQMRRVEQMRAAIIQHCSPRGRRRWHAKSQETHGGFGEDRTRHADRRLNNYRLNNVRQNVADKNSEITCAEGPRRFHIFFFPRGQHLRPYQACVADPSAERKRENQVENPRATKRDKGNRDQDSRKRQKRVHHDHVDEAVDAPTVVAGDRADDQTNPQRHRHHAASHQHRDSRTVDETGKDIAAQFVRAADLSP